MQWELQYHDDLKKAFVLSHMGMGINTLGQILGQVLLQLLPKILGKSYTRSCMASLAQDPLLGPQDFGSHNLGILGKS